MRRYVSMRAAVGSASKTPAFPGAQGLDNPEGHGGLPAAWARGATPGVVFGRGARERTAQEPGRVSFLLETIRLINGAPVTNPPCTVGVCEAHARRGQEQAPHRGRPEARGTVAEAEGNETSEGRIRAMKPGNRVAPGAGRAKAARVRNELGRERCLLPRWQRACHRNYSG